MMSTGKCTQMITAAAWTGSRFYFSTRTLQLKLVSKKNVIPTRTVALQTSQ